MSTGDILSRQNAGGTAELKTFMERTILNSSTLNYELDRLVKYQLHWNFYQGKHWKSHNETLLSFNYVRAMLDKVNMFLLGKTAFSIKVSSYLDDVIEEEQANTVERILNKTWRRNKKVQFTYELLQMGSICGDVWTLVEFDIQKKYGKLKVLDSRHCFPEFKDGDIDELSAFVLRFPLGKNPNEYKVRVVKYTLTEKRTWYQKDTSDETGTTKYEQNIEKNTYGIIPVVHIKNYTNPGSYYSVSDCEDIVKLNKVYNELSQEIKGIIDYYATPTTVVTGATIKSLKRGLGNIWSGLPSEANVFNLGLDVDLGSSQQFLQQLKLSMHELSGVPETALGQIQPISNTSGAALQLAYQPLVQKADQKAITYGDGIEEINSILLMYEKKFNGNDDTVKSVKGNLAVDYRAKPIFPYGFPKDNMNVLQEAQVALQLGINSRRNIMEELGIENVSDVMKEITKDQKLDQEIAIHGQQIMMKEQTKSEASQPQTQKPEGEEAATPE